MEEKENKKRERAMFVTVAEKSDHLPQVSDIEILVPLCTLCNNEVRIAIAYTVLE